MGLLTSLKSLVGGKPRWCSFASRVQDFSGTYDDRMDLSATPRGVLHTTEGTSWPSYGGGKSAPHFTVMPDWDRKLVVVRQHFPTNYIARALVHSRWPDTNRLNCIQIELVGTCDTRNSDSKWFVGNWPNWYYDGIAQLMRWVEENTGVQRSTSVKFVAYPASYGFNNGVRLNALQWQRATGWMGHQHVDQNDHGDPGLVDIDYLLGSVTNRPPASPIPNIPAEPTRPIGALPLVVDGRFGVNTIAALQRVTGTSVDGVWGPNSIRALQGFVGVTADGLVGPNTVRALQAACGAKVDGIWGSGTTTALQKSLNAGTFKRRSPETPNTPKPAGKLVVDGSFGPNTIKALQKVLGVSQDGIFGPNSRKALQKRLGVAQDGIIGKQTVRALQKKLGVDQDGLWGSRTTSALQAALNAGRF